MFRAKRRGSWHSIWGGSTWYSATPREGDQAGRAWAIMASRRDRLLSPIVHAHSPPVHLARGDGVTLRVWQTCLGRLANLASSALGDQSQFVSAESIAVLLDDDAHGRVTTSPTYWNGYTMHIIMHVFFLPYVLAYLLRSGGFLTITILLTSSMYLSWSSRRS